MINQIPQKGDVYWHTPDDTAGKEQKERRRWVVLTPKSVNSYGVMTVMAITTGGGGPREAGFTVRIQGKNTTGVAVLTQVRSYDWRIRNKEFDYVETLDSSTMVDVIDRYFSLIDPS